MISATEHARLERWLAILKRAGIALTRTDGQQLSAADIARAYAITVALLESELSR